VLIIQIVRDLSYAHAAPDDFKLMLHCSGLIKTFHCGFCSCFVCNQ